MSIAKDFDKAYRAQHLVQRLRRAPGVASITLPQAMEVLDTDKWWVPTIDGLDPLSAPGVLIEPVIADESCWEVERWLPLSGWETRDDLESVITFFTHPGQLEEQIWMESPDTRDRLRGVSVDELAALTVWRIARAHRMPRVGPDIDVDQLWNITQAYDEITHGDLRKPDLTWDVFLRWNPEGRLHLVDDFQDTYAGSYATPVDYLIELRQSDWAPDWLEDCDDLQRAMDALLADGTVTVLDVVGRYMVWAGTGITANPMATV